MNKFDIKNRNLDNKLHKMRENKVTPGVIYGPMINNTPIKATKKELQRVTKKMGEVYEVMYDESPVFVKFSEIQKDPVTNAFLHFSLMQLPQGTESKVDVP